MFCCVIEGELTLSIPATLRSKRRYDVRMFYCLNKVYKLQKGKWSEFVLSWEDPLPVATELGLFSVRKAAKWKVLTSPPSILNGLKQNVSVTEYRLGHGCVLVALSIRDTNHLYISTQKTSNLHLLGRYFKKRTICT